jgi:hypothetical protein
MVQQMARKHKHTWKNAKIKLTECICVPQEGIDNPESKSHSTALREVDQQQTDTTACYWWWQCPAEKMKQWVQKMGTQ